MFSQTNLTTRRQFLERSAWGFGSAFILPSLLAGCTDHQIPDPDPGEPVIPPLGDYNVDWNDAAKTAVTTGLGMIPVVGEILSGVVDIFWPIDGTDVWGKVQTDLEISKEVFSLVEDQLGGLTPTPTGLISFVQSYRNEIAYGTPSSILGAWNIAVEQFAGAQKFFQDPTNKVDLLPLFAQFANLYLALLRDPFIPSRQDPSVLTGRTWGRTDSELTNIDLPALRAAISTFTAYVTKTYQENRDNISKSVAQSEQLNEPFYSLNTFDRKTSLNVLDYMDTWAYYDVTIYPNGARNSDGTPINLLTREIYTDPYGNTYGSNPVQYITLSSPPTQRPIQLSAWAGQRLDAVQLTYPDGSGPGGATQTKRMGDQTGGTNQGPLGGVFDIAPTNPIIQVYVTYDYPPGKEPDPRFNTPAPYLINTLQFKFNQGPPTNQIGKDKGQFHSNWVGYMYQALSSIYIPGTAVGFPNTSANCIVFGFMYWQSPQATLRGISTIYVTSPQEHSATDFAQAFPKLGITGNLITAELKAARKAHWEWIKARAK